MQRHALGRFDYQRFFSGDVRRHPALLIPVSSNAHKAPLPDLNQKRPRGAQIEIRLRRSFTININTALLDQASRFRHRRRELQLNQQPRQLPWSSRNSSLFNIVGRLLVAEHLIERSEEHMSELQSHSFMSSAV